jgi:hypothetical protein
VTTDPGSRVDAAAPVDPPEYELAGEPAGGAPAAAADPGTDAAGAPPARVLAYRAPALHEVVAAEDLYFPSRVRDLYAPAVLLLLGVALGAFGLFDRLDTDTVVRTLVSGSAYIVVKLLMLAVCIPLITRVAGVAFGPTPQAVLKLCAIAILPETIALLIVNYGGWCVGTMLGLPAGLALCWTMFSLLFEFDVVEAGFCAVIYWGVGLVFGAGWLTLLLWMLSWAW